VINFLNGTRLDIDRRQTLLHGIRPNIDHRQTFLNEHFQCETVKPVKKLLSNARHGDRILLSKGRPMPFFVFWNPSLNFWRAFSLDPTKRPSPTSK
jgi:hypothetical protein